jgi:DNA primase
MTEDERVEALELLRDPKLCERIVEDLGRAGIVGEETNKLVCYLAATSRKLEEPLAVVIQSSSAAGKSSLMEAVLALIPEEERVQYSAMTGQSLFYMSGKNLKHKILAIVEEEGAERASYALKLLQSEGELTIASTGKDPSTGRHVTQTYRVEGPVMIVLTTTASEVDEELLNRCLVLTVDEGREQTRLIHDRQRRAQTLAGLLERDDRQHLRRLHRNAQRLLQPVFVVNPFAPDLDFASHVTRTRRDHMKYLTLIRAVTLLHQHQRPLKTTTHRGRRVDYIEASREDVEIATRLARAVLGRSLDELPPQTRRLLDLVTELVHERMARDGAPQSEVRFTRRELREWTCWGQTQLRLHLERLEEHEYLIGHRLGRGAGGRQAHYELLEEAPGSRRSSVVEGGSSGVHRGVIGPSSGGHRGAPIVTPSEKKAGETHLGLNGQKFTPREPTSSAS